MTSPITSIPLPCFLSSMSPCIWSSRLNDGPRLLKGCILIFIPLGVPVQTAPACQAVDCMQQFIRNTNGALARIKRTGQSRAGVCLQAVQQTASVHNYWRRWLLQCLPAFICFTRLQRSQRWVSEASWSVHLGSGRRCPSWNPAPNRCVVAGQGRTPVGRAQAGCWCSRTAPCSQTQPSCRPCGGQRRVCRSAAGFHPLFSNLKKKEKLPNEQCVTFAEGTCAAEGGLCGTPSQDKGFGMKQSHRQLLIPT